MNEKPFRRKSKANLAVAAVFLAVLIYFVVETRPGKENLAPPAPAGTKKQGAVPSPSPSVSPKNASVAHGNVGDASSSMQNPAASLGGLIRTDIGGIRPLEPIDSETAERPEQGVNGPQESASPSPAGAISVPLPKEFIDQMNAPRPELPPEMQRQLEGPPPELPPDLKAQLDAPPPEIPEDMKRQLAIPPRIVTLDEVNSGPGVTWTPGMRPENFAPPGPTSTPPENAQEELE